MNPTRLQTAAQLFEQSLARARAARAAQHVALTLVWAGKGSVYTAEAANAEAAAAFHATTAAYRSLRDARIEAGLL
jgi:hypothetical protein